MNWFESLLDFFGLYPPLCIHSKILYCELNVLQDEYDLKCPCIYFTNKKQHEKYKVDEDDLQ